MVFEEVLCIRQFVRGGFCRQFVEARRKVFERQSYEVDPLDDIVARPDALAIAERLMIMNQPRM